jgi:hypothetical protein
MGQDCVLPTLLDPDNGELSRHFLKWTTFRYSCRAGSCPICYGLEIGYWIRADSIKRGYATETAAALTRVAVETDGIRRVEIRCDVDNLPSAAIPRKLGFTLEAILKAEPVDKMVWSMSDELYCGVL